MEEKPSPQANPPTDEVGVYTFHGPTTAQLAVRSFKIAILSLVLWLFLPGMFYVGFSETGNSIALVVAACVLPLLFVMSLGAAIGGGISLKKTKPSEKLLRGRAYAGIAVVVGGTTALLCVAIEILFILLIYGLRY